MQDIQTKSKKLANLLPKVGRKVRVELLKPMHNIRAYLPQVPFRRLSICILSCLLVCSCRTPKPGNRQIAASVVLDKTEVKLGDEIHITPDRPLPGWSGEVTVNAFNSRLPVDSKNNAIRVTNDNGFVLVAPNDVCIALKDAKGENIRMANECSHVIVIAPAFNLKPYRDTVNANGGSNEISLKVPRDQELKLGDVPDWVKLKIEPGLGPDPVIRYRVDENKSYKARSAAIMIGDARFDLTQWGSPYVEIPFRADFTKPPIPTWELAAGELKAAKSHEAPPAWILDNQPNEEATVHSSAEGPSGNAAFVVERNLPSADAWKTMIWLPGIRTQQGGGYKASIWLKAEFPVSIGLEFGQRNAPYANCGIFQWVDVAPAWKQFTVRFRATHAACGPENNRFSIHAGRVLGKLWIADFSLVGE
jgi:hypothetical protein